MIVQCWGCKKRFSTDKTQGAAQCPDCLHWTLIVPEDTTPSMEECPNCKRRVLIGTVTDGKCLLCKIPAL